MITFPLQLPRVSFSAIYQSVSQLTHLITSIFRKSHPPKDPEVAPKHSDKTITDLLKKIGHGMCFADTDSYMGSVLQALIAIPAATKKIWSEDTPRLLEHPTTAEDSYAISDYFLKHHWKPSRYIHGQQDPGEFLPFVLNSLSISNVLIPITANKILHTQDVVRALACTDSKGPEVLTIGIYGRTEMGVSDTTAVMPSKTISITVYSRQNIQANYELSAVVTRFGGGNVVNCFYETFIPQSDGTWVEYAERVRRVHKAHAIMNLIAGYNYLCIYSKK